MEIKKHEKKKNKVIEVIKITLAISFLLSIPACYQYCGNPNEITNENDINNDKEIVFELK